MPESNDPRVSDITGGLVQITFSITRRHLNMNESTAPPGLCARCGRDPAENGAQIGEDWYCQDDNRHCYIKARMERANARNRPYFGVEDYSPEVRARIEARLGGLS